MTDYKLVPVEPTPEMLEAGEYAQYTGCYVSGIYADMLAAAPAVQGEPVGWVNSDELDNMLDDRTATLFPVRTGFHGKPLYAAPQPAEQHPEDVESIWMYKGSDGEWKPFVDEPHRLRTIADGGWDVREFFATPIVQRGPGVKWAPEEVANGNKGIRWVSDEGVHGRPTDHDCRVYLESNPNARGCHCPECTMLAASPQPAAHRPCHEAVREGAPYDDPAFSALCREYEIWGTPAAAQCAVFWEAGKRVAEQRAAPDVEALVEALTELCDEIDNHEIHTAISKTNILWFKRKARVALAIHRKQGGGK